MKNKKAQIVQSKLIRWILLIAGFIVVFLLLGEAFGDSRTNIDKDACLTSVTTRATFKLGPVESAKVIPLRCKTEQICLTDDTKNACFNEFKEESKENPITVVETEKDEMRKTVLDTISQSIYDCHEMLGQGQVNFYPTKVIENDYCVICSRIAFEDEVVKEVGEVGYIELYNHMARMKDKDDVSYFQFVYGDNVEEVFSNLNKIETEISDEKFNLNSWSMNLDEDYAIINRITTKGGWLSAGSSLVAGVATVAFGAAVVYFAPISAVGVVGLTILGYSASGGVIAGGLVYVTTFPDGTGEYWAPQPVPYDKKYLKSGELGCDSFENLP